MDRILEIGFVKACTVTLFAANMIHISAVAS